MQLYKTSSRNKRNKNLTPVEQEQRRRRREQQVKRSRRLQPFKTLGLAILWFATLPVYVRLISPFVSYMYAEIMVAAIIFATTVLVHLYPTRTPPWRTVFWAFWIIAFTGSIMLSFNAGTAALTTATIVGVIFIALRVNQNGRKLVGVIKDWRELR